MRKTEIFINFIDLKTRKIKRANKERIPRAEREDLLF